MRQVLLAAAIAVLPAAAAASPSLGLRLGYEGSSGSAAKGTPMSDVMQADVPVQLEALWRFGEHFSAGVYYSFALGLLSKQVTDACAHLTDQVTGEHIAATCSAWEMRAGIRFEYAFPELSDRFAPWLGAGTGWEWVREKIDASRGSSAWTTSGWEVMSLDGGADVKVAPKLWIGPYLGYRFGQYSRLGGYAIVTKAFHSWLGIGVRGKWDF